MIEDTELREIFKIESAEHIQLIEENFLRLEKEPQNVPALEEAFREAHSLKGAARMIGLTSIETLAHRLEDILGAARKGSARLSSEIIDHLCEGLDAIRSLVKEAVLGLSSGVTVSHVLKQLVIGPESSQPCPSGPAGKIQNSDASECSSELRTPDSQLEPSVRQPETMGMALEDFRIDTIRVETNRLDKLMSQTGELNVTKLGISQRVEDIKDAIILWEDIYKHSADFGIQHEELRKEDSGKQHIKSRIEKLGAVLGTFKNALNEDSSRLDLVNAELGDSINRTRLLPFSTIFNLFQRMVRDLAKDTSKEVELVIEGGDTTADKRIIEEIKDPLMHMVRNALDHGIEVPDERERNNKPHTGTITLKAYQTPSNVVIEVNDDGHGLDSTAIGRAALKRKIVNESELAAMSPAQIQSLILISGVSTSTFVSDVSGRGVGLDVVRANVERLKGAIAIESLPGKGCTIRVQLPLTLATSRVMLVAVNNLKYAIPVDHIQTTCLVHRNDVFTIEGRSAIIVNKMPVSVAGLSELLELTGENAANRGPNRQSEKLPCVILSVHGETVGLLVDELLDEQEIVLKQYSSILKRARNISGATILGNGTVCMVLNPFDLVKSARKMEALISAEKPDQEVAARQRILVAEDSITVRTQMKRILEGAGYEVVVAVDGLDAYNKLAGSPFDALVSDIMMPNMTGLALTEKVRQNKKYKEMPVILVTSLASDEDKQKGLEAGANAYITKPSFDQRVFLETLGRLI